MSIAGPSMSSPPASAGFIEREGRGGVDDGTLGPEHLRN
jgi:hypothetical protein